MSSTRRRGKTLGLDIGKVFFTAIIGVLPRLFAPQIPQLQLPAWIIEAAVLSNMVTKLINYASGDKLWSCQEFNDYAGINVNNPKKFTSLVQLEKYLLEGPWIRSRSRDCEYLPSLRQQLL